MDENPSSRNFGKLKIGCLFEKQNFGEVTLFSDDSFSVEFRVTFEENNNPSDRSYAIKTAKVVPDGEEDKGIDSGL